MISYGVPVPVLIAGFEALCKNAYLGVTMGRLQARRVHP